MRKPVVNIRLPGAPLAPGSTDSKRMALPHWIIKHVPIKILTVKYKPEAIQELLPTLAKNKCHVVPKSVLYRLLIKKGFFQRSQLSPTSFYRMVRVNNLFDVKTTEKLRLSFCMQYANELWQADTLYGPSIKQPDGKWRKTFLIAFLDDASRVITHAEFFYRDNTDNMIDAFRTALYKRGNRSDYILTMAQIILQRKSYKPAFV